jgi:hypothetical protein
MSFLFRVKSMLYFLLIVSLILAGEYFLYTSLASQTNLMNGIYNGIISVFFLLLFFFKHFCILYMQYVNRTPPGWNMRCR